MRKALLVLVSLSVIVLAAIGGSAYWIHRYMHTPISLDQAVPFQVEPGSGLRQISVRLHKAGIIDEPEFFHWYSRLLGKATAIRAGEYLVAKATTPAELLDQLVSGDVILHSLTVVEGWTFAQMQKAVRDHAAIRITADSASAEALMAAIGAAGVHPEGQFFPDTYRFPRGTTDSELFRQAYELMQSRLRATWEQRSADLPLGSAYEALILASDIEKETALESERKRIAGVFVRRLKRGMRLQTDPTVIYGLGPEFNGNLRRRDLVTDTPYNTYTRAGLPPTPIALPGGAALLAAVQPEEGEAMYFVATGLDDGSHYFSATLEEHNQAVKRYLDTLRQRRKER